MTYQASTRAEGIAKLAALADNSTTSAAATKAWRQALQWLPVNGDSIAAYQAYLAKHPDDGTISAALAEARNPKRTVADAMAARRSAGFAALEAGRLGEAETAFRDVLAQNPDDADALGGLGLVRLRQNNAEEARGLLSRAIAADPAHKSRWEQALQGASVGEEYASARNMIARGQLDAAERQLRAITARGGDINGALAMLADVQARRGDLSGAETSYRTLLARQPNNAEALLGLAQVLGRAGRSQEAAQLLDRAQQAGDTRGVGRLRAEALRQQAGSVSDPEEKIALLRAASASAPPDPWIRLDLARALSAAGRKAEARQVMSEVTGAARPTTDDLRAGALFAAEDGRPDEAAALVAKLPPAARTADMRSLLAHAQLQSEIQAAIGLGGVSPTAAREKLLMLAAQPDPDGSRGVAVAQAFLQMHNPAAAREALATAQAATPMPTAAQRIAYAGVLLQAGDERGTQILLRSLDGATGLTRDQAAALNRLRAGAAIRTADTLNAQGRQAEAYDVLEPELARNPDNPDLAMAVARLYARADAPRKAMAINQDLLSRNPDNLDARRGALDAAIQSHDWVLAERLVHDGIELAPDDPRVWMMSAALHRARGNNRAALADLRRALDLRQQAVGADQPRMRRTSDAGGATSVSVYQTAAGQDDALVQPGGNPFRRSGGSDSTSVASVGAANVPADPMSADISRQIASVQEDLAPKLTVGPEFRSRTGTSGLDSLTEVSTSMELLASPFGRGQLSVQATPTFLNSGNVPSDANSQMLFGTGALGGHVAPGSQHAEGVGISVGYKIGWLQADVGSSPLGFLEQNVLGGVELSPEIADGVRLRVVGERRAVTDSVLSYAGTKDPATGTQWGGVTRTRGHAQIEFSAGKANFYAGGGYSSLTGVNVASNQEYEFGAGGSYSVWRSGSDEVRVGLDLVDFGYQKNLRHFTLGQGGYFSPQSYFAALVPVRYTGKTEEWTWSLGGAVGYQTYNEHNSNVFPNNNGLQLALDAAATGNPTINIVYPGQDASGIVGNATGSAEYIVDPNFRLGGRASYQHAGNWSEAIGMLYARYIFNGGI